MMYVRVAIIIKGGEREREIREREIRERDQRERERE